MKYPIVSKRGLHRIAGTGSKGQLEGLVAQTALVNSVIEIESKFSKVVKHTGGILKSTTLDMDTDDRINATLKISLVNK